MVPWFNSGSRCQEAKSKRVEFSFDIQFSVKDPIVLSGIRSPGEVGEVPGASV